MTTSLIAFLWTLDLVVFGLGLFLLFERITPSRLRHPAARDLLRLVMLTGIGCILAVMGCMKLFHNPFAVMNGVGNMVFFAVAPLMILRGGYHLATWYRSRDQASGPRSTAQAPRWGAVLLMTGCVLTGTYLHARFVAPHQLAIRRHTILSERLAGLEKPVKVAVVADFQCEAFGDYERSVFEILETEAPDLVLFPGDYIQVPDKDDFAAIREELVRAVDRLAERTPLGVYAVIGDVDRGKSSLQTSRAVFVDDQVIPIPGCDRVRLAGISGPHSRSPFPENLAKRCRDFEGLTLVMGHSPDYAFPLIQGSLETPALCVAGHTHGGQVVIPFLGPVLTLSRLPREYAGGLHILGKDSWLLVSRGVGLERWHAPRIRFNCPPELVFLTLAPPDPGRP